MTKQKEIAREHFIDMIMKSWTYERLTPKERDDFWDVLPQKIKGTYWQRIDVCGAIYAAYLKGLGYSPIGWREAK